MAKRRIYIAYVGGTIGMRTTDRGRAPAPGYLAEQLRTNPIFNSDELPEFTINEYEPLLDSSNMGPSDWIRIAQDIEQHLPDYDGVLVIHGTDTMAYTAAALSFMLENLNKPVIITGSQVPLCELRNDAMDNLVTSLILLQRYADRIAEVCIYFGGRFLRGNRAKKIDGEFFGAFDSPNLPQLGRVRIDFELSWDLIRAPKATRKPLHVQPIGTASVAAFRLFPGLKAETLAPMLDGIQGLVLECYGAGNAPHRDLKFMDVLREANRNGVVIVDVPQPIHGCANLSLYATGRALLDVGVVSGFDMTPEAALTKLLYLLSRESNPDEVRRLVQTDMRGEITLP